MKTPTISAGFIAAALLLAVGAGSVQAADKPTDKGSKNACFWTRNITGFAAPDDHTVYVKVSLRDVYRLDLMIACPDVEFNQHIGLVASPGAGGSICGPLDAEIVSHAAGLGRQSCPVKAMHKLTPDEIAALPKKARP